MEVKPALALPDGLEVIGIEMIDEVLTITAVSAQMYPCCPLCGTPTERFHSRYTRQITDLPCGGQRVCLLVFRPRLWSRNCIWMYQTDTTGDGSYLVVCHYLAEAWS